MRLAQIFRPFFFLDNQTYNLSLPRVRSWKLKATTCIEHEECICIQETVRRSRPVVYCLQTRQRRALFRSLSSLRPLPLLLRVKYFPLTFTTPETMYSARRKIITEPVASWRLKPVTKATSATELH